jgi:hypothetical protein
VSRGRRALPFASAFSLVVLLTVAPRIASAQPEVPPPPDPPIEPGPPAVAPPAESAAALAPRSPAIAPAPPPVDDVYVHGGRAAKGAGSPDSLARAEARQLPGAFGDPFRAIEAMPGMTPVITGLPYFYVRGAPPANVGYYFDGIRVPYLFHFGLGPAVIHPALIAKTDLHRGGYPAALGRYSGGIVDATAMPPGDSFHGEAQLRLIDAGAFAEVPFANGRGSALAAARYSYTAALFSLVSSDTTLDYRDYQARVSYAATARDTLAVLAFGAYDYAAQRQTIDSSTRPIFTASGASRGTYEIDRVLFASEFHRADLRWDRQLSSGGHLQAATTVGFDRTRVEARRAATDVMTAARVGFVQPFSSSVLFRAGADVVVDSYSADSLPTFADDDDVVVRHRAIFDERVDFATGARVDAVLTMVPRMEIVPGIRVDAYGSAEARALAFDPRLGARFAVTDRVRIIHAYGLASQPPSAPITLPGITMSRLRGGLQRAAQTSGAVEVDLPQDFTATAGVFHNAFYDLNDALGTAQIELIDIERTDALLGKSRGSAFGMELGIRRKFSRRVAGLASYTLSHSTRTASGRTFISSYDRPHVLTAAVSVDLGQGWRVGARFVTYSGIPMSPATPAFPEQIVGAPPARTPAFYRLDARFEKRWSIGKTGYIAAVFEALNATLSREVTGYECGTAIAIPTQSPTTPTCSERVIGPISVPSLGVEGGI